MEADGLTFNTPSAPSQGGAVICTDSACSYTPAADFFGTETFTFTITDDSGAANATGPAATVTINVAAVNDTPVANGQVVAAVEDVGKAITLTASDVDPDSLTFNTPTASAQGGVVSCVAASCSYTSATNFAGQDTFTFTVTDNSGAANDTSAAATVTIDVAAVEEPPTALDQAQETGFNLPVTITLTGIDPDGAAQTAGLIFTIDAPPDGAKGSLNTLVADTVTFTPATDFEGDATFTFQVDDGNTGSGGGPSTPGTVTITVLSSRWGGGAPGGLQWNHSVWK